MALPTCFGPRWITPRGKLVALHRIVEAMISKEIYIKRKNVRTERGVMLWMNRYILKHVMILEIG